ncbi:MAG: HDOD domain-containing protein [Candidatus Abyssobacteria bacterium SURF_5]|uniref:HDOD domain-containing protein n=1 Tax=Abyssobacteria bacterium (strain SURF_5) TaxID=2093360 RepID=A0A3A4N8D1_ABYX5|nr:MAG: HDOD domain-containing protein [Candidatus Abyssubacteria bacterium SURF_5]
MTHSKADLKLLVERVQELPTIADLGIKILELASDPDVSIADLSKAIHQDPSFAGRILKIANSPFYGMTRQVDSLHLAIVVLGLNEVRNIALGLSLFEAFKKMNSHALYNRRQFWLHSASCAMVAHILSCKVGMRAKGNDFIAGLLHDMGKIVIDEYFGEEFSLIYDEVTRSDVPMIEAERQILGESHERVGEWLVDKWRLPDSLKDAILYHHSLPSMEKAADVKDQQLAALAFLAESFCGHHRIGWDGDASCSRIEEPRAWELVFSNQDENSAENISRILSETFQAYYESVNYIMLI